MDKDKLLEEANKARSVAVTLAENIYRYLGNEISKDDLKNIVDSLISDDLIVRFDHLYIKKDTYRNTFVSGFVDDPDNMCYEDDTEELIIKEDSKRN